MSKIMNDFMHDMDAGGTFNKARLREFVSRLGAIIAGRKKDDLIPFSYAYSMLKPHSEAYRGIKHVPISHIVGSEGRYRDFNRVFLPRGAYLRERWERINKAHKARIELPPVRLYEIGGVYFVRDGNHRISVALSRGIEYVDAEVTSLETEIALHKDMTKADLKRAVIEYEKKRFYKETHLKKLRTLRSRLRVAMMSFWIISRCINTLSTWIKSRRFPTPMPWRHGTTMCTHPLCGLLKKRTSSPSFRAEQMRTSISGW
jgi:hypothetical protein